MDSKVIRSIKPKLAFGTFPRLELLRGRGVQEHHRESSRHLRRMLEGFTITIAIALNTEAANR